MLESIYRAALEACAPDVLIRRLDRTSLPRTVVSIGKCAGALLDGFGDFDEAFAVVPAGYPRPRAKAIVYEGGHPGMTHDSFRAGKALIDFVRAHDAITFLISGGGSACVEWPLDAYGESDLIAANAQLVRSDLPIGAINCVRKHLSAIKGGRLAALVARSVTLVYSDVSTGALADVASGPTLADPTTVADARSFAQRAGIALAIEKETPKAIRNGRAELIADNATLTRAAAHIAEQRGLTARVRDDQIESDVDRAASDLAAVAASLREGEIFIAGGEPTVTRRGEGRGGRCSELGVRFALAARDAGISALFGSSDGVDGNSGAAGVVIDKIAALDRAAAERELSRSNSMEIIAPIGHAIPLCPSGNNLRDIYLLART